MTALLFADHRLVMKICCSERTGEQARLVEFPFPFLPFLPSIHLSFLLSALFPPPPPQLIASDALFSFIPPLTDGSVDLVLSSVAVGGGEGGGGTPNRHRSVFRQRERCCCCCCCRHRRRRHHRHQGACVLLVLPACLPACEAAVRGGRAGRKEGRQTGRQGRQACPYASYVLGCCRPERIGNLQKLWNDMTLPNRIPVSVKNLGHVKKT
ncbi:uncharacterized protein [Physcomitrium patens]